MCNKKERKRDRRWYLFPVSTLGAVHFAVHGGTGRFVFFSRRDGAFFFVPRRDGAVVFFFRGGTGRLLFFSEAGRGGFFFFSTGRDGAVFFCFFRGPGRDGCFWRWHFFWRDGAKSLHRPAKGGLNRPASRPCKGLDFSPEKNAIFAVTRSVVGRWPRPRYRTVPMGKPFRTSVTNMYNSWKSVRYVN